MFPKRIDGEGDAAGAAYHEYAELGPERSLESLRRKLGKKSVRHLERWSSTFSWVDRCRQHDQAIVARREQARQRAIEDEAERWAARQKQQRETDWAMAQALR